MFSAIYAGLGRANWAHLGVVGNVLGKEMGKDYSRLWGSPLGALASKFTVRNTANLWALRRGLADVLTALCPRRTTSALSSDLFPSETW